MLDLDELKQLAAFARLGTLAKVAEEFHVSTPSITRSMQHLEERFGAPLFTRGKNRIALNENGRLAAECAERVLREAEDAVRRVRAFDARRRTIAVRSCAPAPLWELLRHLGESRPEMTVSSRICQNKEVLSAWADGSCDVAILPFPVPGEKPRVYMRERLFVCIPPEHELAGSKTLSFAKIDGFNFLLRSELGFWDTLCRQKMPASRFLVQTDEFAYGELVRTSSLPCFATDYSLRRLTAHFPRVAIPVADAEADVRFYIAARPGTGLFKAGPR